MSEKQNEKVARGNGVSDHVGKLPGVRTGLDAQPAADAQEMSHGSCLAFVVLCALDPPGCDLIPTAIGWQAGQVVGLEDSAHPTENGTNLTP